ncbi:hypothetical protein GQ472_06145 [archaeon]|nr:hypothetical protein [archaeon]
MALSIVDVTGLTNSIIILSALCVLSMILIGAVFYRLSEHAKVIYSLTERMAKIEDRYIKISHDMDTKVLPKAEVKDGSLVKVDRRPRRSSG